MDSTITFCVESGRYEAYAMVLARSLRRFGGRLNDFRCVAVAPRKEYFPSLIAQEILRELGVEVVLEDINRDLADYALANKPLALKHTYNPGQSSLWLDTDTVIVGDPTSEFDSDSDVLVCPVFGKGIGSSGLDDPNDTYWQDIYKLFGVKQSPFCTTVLGGDFIRAYFNTGVIYSQSPSNLFDKWHSNLRTALSTKICPPNGSIYMIEQSVFAATVAAMELDIGLLPVSCNYPIHASKVVEARHHIAIHQSRIWHHTNKFSDVFEKLSKKAQTKGWSLSLIDNFIDQILKDPFKATNRPQSIWVRAYYKTIRTLKGKV